MNEVDWLTGSDPLALLDHLGARASDRKLRLLACACCRRYWAHVKSATCRRAVEVCERFAEGEATLEDLYLARGESEVIVQYPPEFEAHAYEAVVAALEDQAGDAARHVLDACRRHAGRLAAYEEVFRNDEAFAAASDTEQAWQSDLVRAFFGNPFRPVRIAPAWLCANDGAVRKLATVIDEGHQYADLPYLGDALMDAGCDDEVLLRACREPGRSVLEGGCHWRGFWVLDLLLGREAF
jgi:hypothetical protein